MFGHICIVARDIDRLSAFYQRVFGWAELAERRELAGDNVSRGNGVPNSELSAARLGTSVLETQFLEIFQYKTQEDRPAPLVNQTGYSHISVTVDDIYATLRAVLDAGGTRQGDVTNMGSDTAPALCVYVRDIEGNVIELEQGADLTQGS